MSEEVKGDAAAADAAAGDGNQNAESGAGADAGDKTLLGAANKDGAGDKGEGDGAPEAYGAFTLPDGVEIAEPILGEFTSVAKTLGLSQEKAQSLIDLATKAMSLQAESMLGAYTQQRAAWASEVKADPEIGGAKLKETLSLASEAIKAFGDDSLIEALNVTGAGDHPAMVRLFSKLGRLVAEDKVSLGAGGGAASESKSAAQILYGGGSARAAN